MTVECSKGKAHSASSTIFLDHGMSARDEGCLLVAYISDSMKKVLWRPLNAWSQQRTKQRSRVPAVDRRRRWEMFFPAILLSKEVVGTTANFGWIGAARCGEIWGA